MIPDSIRRHQQSIARTSAIGLWGSVAFVIIASLFLLVSPWQFYPSRHTAQWMLIAGSILAVLALSMALLVVRKHIPSLRQADSLDTKFAGYASHIRSVYSTLLFVVFALCAMMVLSNQNVLLMLAIVVVLFLFLSYPNIYRIKIDLGLTDDEMKLLYPDRYLPDQPDDDHPSTKES